MRIISLGNDTGIHLLENFLSNLECSLLIRSAKKRAMTEEREPVKGHKGKFHICSYVYLENEIPFLKKIHLRIQKLTRIPPQFHEPFLVVQHSPDGDCQPHNDFRQCVDDDPESGRVAQILFFLNDIEEGGDTHFTELGIKFPAKRGNAILWYGIEGLDLPRGKEVIFPKKHKENVNAIHRSIPIKKGDQWLGVKFFHDRERK